MQPAPDLCMSSSSNSGQLDCCQSRLSCFDFCVLYTDRSETARLLLGFGADAGVQDSGGQLCITAMITKMTSVVRIQGL